MEADYIIDGDKARLTNVDKKIQCKRCDRVLALKNRESMMIKTQLSIITKTGIVLRCGHCKMYNILDDIGIQTLAI